MGMGSRATLCRATPYTLRIKALDSRNVHHCILYKCLYLATLHDQAYAGVLYASYDTTSF